MSTTKTDENTFSIFNYYFSKHIYTLAHQTYYLHIVFTLYNQYSFGLIFSWNPKKSHTDQVYHKFFYFVWKETTAKPSKLATAQNFFSSVYFIVTACFHKCFLFHVITGRHCFYKSLLISWGFFNRHVLALFEASNWKEVRILFFISIIRLQC